MAARDGTTLTTSDSWIYRSSNIFFPRGLSIEFHKVPKESCILNEHLERNLGDPKVVPVVEGLVGSKVHPLYNISCVHKIGKYYNVQEVLFKIMKIHTSNQFSYVHGQTVAEVYAVTQVRN